MLARPADPSDPLLCVLGCVAASFPSPAEGYEDNSLDVHSYVVQNPAATFFWRVRGDTLTHEGILDGSVLVVDRSVPSKPGKLAVVEDGEVFAVLRLDRSERVVCGIVVACVTRFR